MKDSESPRLSPAKGDSRFELAVAGQALARSKIETLDSVQMCAE